jgi:hypothetical protein
LVLNEKTAVTIKANGIVKCFEVNQKAFQEDLMPTLKNLEEKYNAYKKLIDMFV